jgi:hypothetical protein
MAKAKSKTKSTTRMSVRDWLASHANVSVSDAKAFAKRTKRSEVTVYRQAAELGLQAVDGRFVKAKRTRARRAA